MEKLIKPILFGSKALLMVIGAVLLIATYLNWNPEWEKIDDVLIIMAGGDVFGDFMSYLSKTMWYTVIVNILVVLTIIGFGIYGVATDFKKGKNFLIGAGLMLIIVAIAYYTMSSGYIDPEWETKKPVTESISMWADTGIFTFIILIAVAVLGIIYGEVSKLLK